MAKAPKRTYKVLGNIPKTKLYVIEAVFEADDNASSEDIDEALDALRREGRSLRRRCAAYVVEEKWLEDDFETAERILTDRATEAQQG